MLGPYWGTRSVLPRPRANIPQYGPRARLVSGYYFFQNDDCVFWSSIFFLSQFRLVTFFLEKIQNPKLLRSNCDKSHRAVLMKIKRTQIDFLSVVFENKETRSSFMYLLFFVTEWRTFLPLYKHCEFQLLKHHTGKRQISHKCTKPKKFIPNTICLQL